MLVKCLQCSAAIKFLHIIVWFIWSKLGLDCPVSVTIPLNNTVVDNTSQHQWAATAVDWVKVTGDVSGSVRSEEVRTRWEVSSGPSETGQCADTGAVVYKASISTQNNSSDTETIICILRSFWNSKETNSTSFVCQTIDILDSSAPVQFCSQHCACECWVLYQHSYFDMSIDVSSIQATPWHCQDRTKPAYE